MQGLVTLYPLVSKEASIRLFGWGLFFDPQENEMLPTSKLEAINEMLSCVGEAPVSQLNTGFVEADVAENILDGITREVQTKGWNFNTETKFELMPDMNNEVVVPANTLKADGTTQTALEDWVLRGGKMYNRKGKTYTSIAPVSVTLVICLDFETLPEAARRYITLKSARVFQDRTVGLPNLHQFNAQDEMQAWIELKDMDMDVSDYSIFDSFDTYQIINRTGGRVR